MINLEECFIDGTFVVAKKGPKSGKDQAIVTPLEFQKIKHQPFIMTQPFIFV